MKATELKLILEQKRFRLVECEREGDYRDIASLKIQGAEKPHVFSIGGETPVLLRWLDDKWIKEEYKNLDISDIQEFAFGDTFECGGVMYEVKSYGHWEPVDVDTKKVSSESSAGLFPAWEADGFED